MKSARAHRIYAALAVLALAVFVLSYAVAYSLTRDAQLIQLAEAPSEASALFGESSPTPIGSPQRFINITDPRAFLEGQTEEGARYVSEAYLKANNIYPIQDKTVWFFHFFVALASGLGALVFGGLWLWSRPPAARARTS